MIMCKSLKGVSLSVFIFIILLVGIGLISWFVYNNYYGESYKSEIISTRTMNILRNEIESFKRFSKLSLIYSSSQAILEQAGKGVTDSEKINAWIKNGPSPPDFREALECLENNTLHYVDLYTKNYTIELPLKYKVISPNSIKYNVTFDEVLSGKYDEGDYNILLENGEIILSTKNMDVSDEVMLLEQVNKNRFWYLYRNFYEWSGENLFGKKFVDCVSSCEGCECVENYAKDALNNLQNRFDEFVDCDYQRECCIRGPSQITGKLNGLTIWKQNECSWSGELKNMDGKNTTGISDNKLGAVYIFTCTDKKYYISSGEGPVPLKFSVVASASLRDLGGC